MSFVCLKCIAGEHGEDCTGRSCPCSCRPTLGLAGPFPDTRDPTAPSLFDQFKREEVA